MSTMTRSQSKTAIITSQPSQSSVKSTITLWVRNYLTRRGLRGMEKHRLCDIGVDQKNAEAEARKPFWL